jgi:predicted ABC-type ATPase
MDRLVSAREDFGFETTLSGRAYVSRLQHWRTLGYRIEIIFLKLPSVALAKARVRARVRQGGHGIPAQDIERRFTRGWENFQSIYSLLADKWSVFDNSVVPARLITNGP